MVSIIMTKWHKMKVKKVKHLGKVEKFWECRVAVFLTFSKAGNKQNNKPSFFYKSFIIKASKPKTERPKKSFQNKTSKQKQKYFIIHATIVFHHFLWTMKPDENIQGIKSNLSNIRRWRGRVKTSRAAVANTNNAIQKTKR